MRSTLVLMLLGILLAGCTDPSRFEQTTGEAVMDLEGTQPEPDE
jgi:hypothetical protein